MSVLERRLHAWRADLADARLRGKVEAARFVEGRAAFVAAPVADIRAAPSDEAGVDSQLLLGDEVRVFDEAEGWAWVQAVRDGYVGYVAAASLADVAGDPTHMVAAPRSFTYARDDLKSPRVRALSMGTLVAVAGWSENRGTRYALLDTGEAMIAGHLRPIGEFAADYVAVAEALEHTPYLWGGTSGFGLDCSGLVQLSMRMAGRAVLRDTDMQERSVGGEIDPGPGGSALRRGDLVFWKGHVAIMADGENVIHANGHTMLVSREPLAVAVERIARQYGQPTRYRRA
jgi:cell wall-associated NlpC family hydrolase